jgi:hypothetical protein
MTWTRFSAQTGDAEDVDAARFDLHDEEHVQAPEEHGVDVQEVAGQDAGCLGGQELPPGRGGPARRRAQPGRSQDPADRAFTDLVPESGKFALNAPVTPSRILPAPAVRPDRGSRRVLCGSFTIGGRPTRPTPSHSKGPGGASACCPRPRRRTPSRGCSRWPSPSAGPRWGCSPHAPWSPRRDRRP